MILYVCSSSDVKTPISLVEVTRSMRQWIAVLLMQCYYRMPPMLKIANEERFIEGQIVNLIWLDIMSHIRDWRMCLYSILLCILSLSLFYSCRALYHYEIISYTHWLMFYDSLWYFYSRKLSSPVQNPFRSKPNLAYPITPTMSQWVQRPQLVPRELRLTLKSHPASRIDKISAGRTKWWCPM